MVDPNEQLREPLNRLQAELEEIRKVNPAVASHVEAILGELHAALAARGTEPLAHRSVVERLSDAVLQYEASHPTLSGNLGSIVHGLSRMGI